MPTTLVPVRCGVFMSLALLSLTTFAADGAKDGALSLTLRTRTRSAAESERFLMNFEQTEWQAKKTAIVICDMWNDHYCRNAARRVAEMAPRMNRVISAARQRGVLIIHCPSGCLDKYRDTPQRKLAQQAPVVKTEIPLRSWCHLDAKHEAKLPVVQTSPCEDQKPRPAVRFFTHQIKTLEIHEGDAITDSAEAFYLMEQRGIDNVIVMGVHTNMCVLGRPFSIRQLKYQGKNVVLMRDMTDSMYNPAQAPYVSHFNGTELVIEHIEKYWCPTITSADILGGEPFRFPRDKRPRAVLVIGEKLYETGESLPRFAIDQLGKDFHIDVVHANPAKPHEFPGLETLATADVLILSVRRRALSERQMRLIRGHIDQGKPVVALRTSSHAFGARGEIPAGHVQWEEFDSELLGGDYTGHFANDKHPRVTLDKSSSSHAILAGIRGDAPWTSPNSLYKSTLIAKSKPLAWGAIAGQPRQPVAWVRQSQKDGRVFYTSLGGPGDFANDNFRLLLRNGVYWAAGLETPGTLHQPEKPAKKAADQGGGC